MITSATKLLENGQTFSLRAVAREASVSAAAPYRHFANREELESAIAVEGFKVLQTRLTDSIANLEHTRDLAALPVAYARYALEHPAVFRLMFGQPCDTTNDERVIVAQKLHDFLTDIVSKHLTGSDSSLIANALWSMTHGMAFLFLDGKLPHTSLEDMEKQVRVTFTAILEAKIIS